MLDVVLIEQVAAQHNRHVRPGDFECHGYSFAQARDVLDQLAETGQADRQGSYYVIKSTAA